MLWLVRRTGLFFLPLLLSLSTCSSPSSSPDGPSPLDGSREQGRDRRGSEARVDGAPPDTLQPDLLCAADPGVALAPGITVFPTVLVAGGQARVVYEKPAALASSSNISVHFGSNYWLPDAAGVVAADKTMAKRSDGAFEAVLQVPAEARLLDLVFFTDTGSTKQWDSNNGLDYHRSVGGPRIGPYLTFRDNLGGQPDREPAQGLTVSFRTDAPCRGRVRYGAGGPLGGHLDEPAPATQHHLRLTGLSPDTLYSYRVECTFSTVSCAPIEQSPTSTFRTAPVAPTSITFLHLSDPQDYRSAGDRWKELAALLSKPPNDNFRFAIITGDLVAGDEPARWWDLFDRGRPLFSSKPVLPVIGNHDTPTAGSNGDFSSFEGLFSPESSSGSATRYGLRYGPCSFLVLNSETSQADVMTGDWKAGGAQYSWVANTLPKLGGTWRFAAWHIPPYNAGARHNYQIDDVRPMTSLFNDQIDWVLNGHEHIYQRTKPIRFTGWSSGKITSTVVASYGGPGGGVGYLVAPVAGHDPPGDTLMPASDPSRALLAYPTPAVIVNDAVAKWAGYVSLTVTGKSLQIDAHSMDEVMPKDSLSYSKP
jgi:hypothetical protein